METSPQVKHKTRGLLSMVNNGAGMHGSQVMALCARLVSVCISGLLMNSTPLYIVRQRRVCVFRIIRYTYVQISVLYWLPSGDGVQNMSCPRTPVII